MTTEAATAQTQTSNTTTTPQEPAPKRRRIFTLPGGMGIAISGRTGCGKSSQFFRSAHVLRILVADTGSGAHKIYARPEAEVVPVVTDNPQESPIQQAMRLVKQWTEQGILWALDSFTTMQEMQVAWHKRFRAPNQQMSLREHQHVVGDLRDLALYLAQRAGFTLFNTSPGGQQRTPEGQILQIPKGIVVGYPALSGLAEGKESVLSRFTTSWIVTPGAVATERSRRIARGFLLPWHDIRGGEIGNFAPIKDPLRVLTETIRRSEDGHEKDITEEVDAFLPLDNDPCTIDAMLERIAERWPQIVVEEDEKTLLLLKQPQKPPLTVVKDPPEVQQRAPQGRRGGR